MKKLISMKIYSQGEKVPFYKEYNNQMNAVFGCNCFVEEYNDIFTVYPLEDNKVAIISDIVYRAIKPVEILKTNTINI